MSRRNLFFGALLMLSACSSDVFVVHNGNMPSNDKISEIKVGQTKEEVQYTLGSPSSVSSFDGNTWLYISSTTKKIAFLKPKLIDRDVLAIYFDQNGEVNRISKLTEKDGQKIGVDSDETTSGGHDIGFFKKYFGGVGTYSPIAPTKEQ